MRKKCSNCGLICFASDEICRRCQSKILYKIDEKNDSQQVTSESNQNKIPWWGYVVFFVLAVVIEFFALLPVLANIGWRHASGAPLSDFEKSSQLWAFVLHFPTVLVPWILNQLIEIFTPFYLFVPLTQVIFWTLFLAFLWKRVEKVYAALITLAFLLAFVLSSLLIFL